MSAFKEIIRSTITPRIFKPLISINDVQTDEYLLFQYSVRNREEKVSGTNPFFPDSNLLFIIKR